MKKGGSLPFLQTALFAILLASVACYCQAAGITVTATSYSASTCDPVSIAGTATYSNGSLCNTFPYGGDTLYTSVSCNANGVPQGLVTVADCANTDNTYIDGSTNSSITWGVPYCTSPGVTLSFVCELPVPSTGPATNPNTAPGTAGPATPSPPAVPSAPSAPSNSPASPSDPAAPGNPSAPGTPSSGPSGPSGPAAPSTPAAPGTPSSQGPNSPANNPFTHPTPRGSASAPGSSAILIIFAVIAMFVF